MLNPNRKTLLAIVAAATMAIAAPLVASTPVLLTVTGAVENTNRGPVDPDMDKLFAFTEVSFDNAMEFDLETLRGLPQTTVKADFPMGGDMVSFEGPLLSDVLAAAGATGETVTVQAMDGYAVEAPLSEMVEKGAVVALARDGKPLGIGGFGPTQIVFPRAERDDLNDMNDDWWIWQIFHIKV